LQKEMEHKQRIGPDSISRKAIPAFVREPVEALLYSHVFISVCAFCLTVETYLLTGLDVSLPMAGFVFLATLFTYNLSSVYRVLRGRYKLAQAAEASWGIRHQKQLALLGIGSLLGAVVLFFLYSLQVDLWFVLLLALISVGYTVPLLYKRVKPLRSVPLLKVFLIALVWSAVTVLFPLADTGVAIETNAVLLLWLRRFLFILALALLFDIRDYTYDRNTRTLTFPGLIGEGYTRLLSLVLLGLYLLLAFYMEEGRVLISLISSVLVAALIVWHASEEKPRIYYALLADGAMLVHFAFVYLAIS
jgi:4-hydroxybenzoate polyprenyltransferase